MLKEVFKVDPSKVHHQSLGVKAERKLGNYGTNLSVRITDRIIKGMESIRQGDKRVINGVEDDGSMVQGQSR